MTYFFAYFPAALMIAFSVPMVLGKVPPDGFYGFRTRKTLSSPSVWYPANKMYGWFLITACVIALLVNSAGLLHGIERAEAWFTFSFCGAVLSAQAATIVYLRRL
jgi:uncharacterized membrane protein